MTKATQLAIISAKRRVLNNRLLQAKHGADYFLSASSGGRCHKLHLYQALGTNPEVTLGDSVQLLRLGNMLHDDKQKLILESIKEDEEMDKLSVEVERELIDLDNNVLGHADVIIKWEAYDGRPMAEIHDDKTVGSYGWKMKVSQQRFRQKGYGKPQPMYEIQLGSYANMLSEEDGIKGVDISLYLDFYNKDNSATRSRQISNSYQEIATQYWHKVNSFIDEYGEDGLEIEGGDHYSIPMEKWECNYCQFASRCGSPLRTKKEAQVEVQITEKDEVLFNKGEL